MPDVLPPVLFQSCPQDAVLPRWPSLSPHPVLCGNCLENNSRPRCFSFGHRRNPKTKYWRHSPRLQRRESYGTAVGLSPERGVRLLCVCARACVSMCMCVVFPEDVPLWSLHSLLIVPCLIRFPSGPATGVPLPVPGDSYNVKSYGN